MTVLASTFVAVRCPCKRMLFKVVRYGTAVLEIKCPRCGLLNEVSL